MVDRAWKLKRHRKASKKATQNGHGRVKEVEERRKKWQRSERPGVPPPLRPPSTFFDLCYVDATLEEVEGAGAAKDVGGEQLMGGRPAGVAPSTSTAR